MALDAAGQVVRSGAFGGVDVATVRGSSHRFPRHAHDTFVLQLVDYGVIEFRCRGREWRAPPGSVILINPHDAHTGAPATEEAISYRTLYPSREALARGLNGAAERMVFERPVVADTALARRLAAAHDALRLEEGAVAEGCLVEAVSLAAEIAGVWRTTDARPERSAVERARDLIESEYATGLSLERIAAAAQRSPHHLSRAFRETLGLTPHEYLTAVRVEHAKRLIGRGRALAETALAVGFCDQGHLNRHFRRLVGVTPGQYRRGVR